MKSRQGLVCEWGSLAVSLASSRRLDLEPGGVATVELSEGESLTLIMSVADRCPIAWVSPEKAERLAPAVWQRHATGSWVVPAVTHAAANVLVVL